MEGDETPSAWTSLILLERFRGGDDSGRRGARSPVISNGSTLLARSRLSARLARRTDPEDIVQSVYRSFFVGVREGRYTLGRGGDLWRLLASITTHKLLRQVRHQTADRRSVEVESPFDQVDERSLRGRRTRADAGSGPRPGRRAGMGVRSTGFLRRRVLELRLQGLPIAAIAEDTGRAERSVRRPWHGSATSSPNGSPMTDDASNRGWCASRRAWRLEGPPRIADFLDDPAALTSDRAISAACRAHLRGPGIPLAGPRPATTGHPGDLFAKFPSLGPVDGLPVDLIGEEYRVRHRWGDRPSHADVLSRFTTRWDEVRDELSRIDGELEGEADPRSVTRPAVRTSPPAGDVDPHPGVPLLSHRDFLLAAPIGAGRFGKVYQARQHSTGRDVAVKFLRKTLLQQPGIVQRFVGEARTVAGLRHPRIVATQGLGYTPTAGRISS